MLSQIFKKWIKDNQRGIGLTSEAEDTMPRAGLAARILGPAWNPSAPGAAASGGDLSSPGDRPAQVGGVAAVAVVSGRRRGHQGCVCVGVEVTP